MVFKYIVFNGGEQKICRDFVGELWGGGKSETLKKVG